MRKEKEQATPVEIMKFLLKVPDLSEERKEMVRQTLDLAYEAANGCIDECISRNILREYLEHNRESCTEMLANDYLVTHFPELERLTTNEEALHE